MSGSHQRYFQDKVVVITGASSGIGAALSQTIAGPGVTMCLAGRDQSKLAATQSAVRQKGGEAVTYVGDLSVQNNCAALIDLTLKTYGKLDILINNAGATCWANFSAMTDDELIEKIMRINYLSAAWCTYYAKGALRQSGGHLACVSSLAGLIGVPGHAAYGASKHALHGLCDALRIEWQADNVDVSIICPDFVVTNLHSRGFSATGAPMGKALDPNSALSANAAAEIIARGLARRDRLISTSRRGKLASIFRGLVPEAIDKIASKQANAHGLIGN